MNVENNGGVRPGRSSTSQRSRLEAGICGVIAVACGSTSPSTTSVGHSGVVAADTDACDLGLVEYGCPAGPRACLDAYFGDGNCGALPPGQGLRVGGDVDCVLTLLRDSVVATFFVLECPAEGGLVDFVTVLGDGTAVLDRYHQPGSSSPVGEQEPERRLLVRPPEFFDACIGSDDPALVTECLTNWWEPGLCLPEPCCPEDNILDLPPC